MVLRAIWVVTAVIVAALFIRAIPYQVNRDLHGYLGANLDWYSGKFLVTSVLPGSPVEKAGIKPSEFLVQVNGRPFPATGDGILGIPYMQSQPGNHLALTIQDQNGSMRQVYVVYSAGSHLPFGMTAPLYAGLMAALDLLLILGYFALGGVIAWRGNNQPFAFLVAFSLIAIPARILQEFRFLAANHLSLFWPLYIFISIGYGCMPLIFSLFPNGRFVPRWIWIYPIVGLFYAVLVNAFGWRPDPNNNIANLLIDAVVIAFGVLIQIYRFNRSSTLQERQQTKWVLFGIAVAVLGFYGYYAGENLILFGEGFVLSQYEYELLARPLFYLALLMVPFTLAISILRYHLWDVDFLIRRTLGYTLLTIALALVYTASVILLQQVLRQITGASSSLAVVISTLGIAAIFNSLRTYIQDFIDRRFYRRKYDAAQALNSFSQTARDEVDIDRLTGVLLGVVAETMQPERASLWLKPVSGQRLQRPSRPG
jgi:hypothetical protein